AQHAGRRNAPADSKSSAAKPAARARTNAGTFARAHPAAGTAADSAARSDTVRWNAQTAERIAIVIGLDIRHIVRRNDRRRHRQLRIGKRIHPRRRKLLQRGLRQFAFTGIERRARSAAATAAGGLLLIL